MKNASFGLAVGKTQSGIGLVYQKIEICQGQFGFRTEPRHLEPSCGRGFPRKVHSMRRAFMGWMLAARLAGMMAAKKEQIARATDAMVRAEGSQEETP